MGSIHECILVLQSMNSLRQLLQSTGLNGVFSLLKVDDWHLATRLTREQLIRELLRFCPDLIHVSGRQLVGTRAKTHLPDLWLLLLATWIDSARPARRCLFAEIVKLTGHDVPSCKQADCFARARAAVRRAKFAFVPRQDVIDFIFHCPER